MNIITKLFARYRDRRDRKFRERIRRAFSSYYVDDYDYVRLSEEESRLLSKMDWEDYERVINSINELKENHPLLSGNQNNRQ